MKLTIAVLIAASFFCLGKFFVGPKEFQIYLAPFLVIVSIAVTIWLQWKNRALTEDKAQYEAIISILKSVHNLIDMQDNSRAVWIRAARDLLLGAEMAGNLKTDEYKQLAAIELEALRSNLYQAVHFKDAESNLKPLPLAFFLGLKDWKRMRPGTAKLAFNALGDNDRENLDQRSVFAIYNFINTYPGKDPLDEIEFSECALPTLGVNEFAGKYLNFTK